MLALSCANAVAGLFTIGDAVDTPKQFRVIYGWSPEEDDNLDLNWANWKARVTIRWNESSGEWVGFWEAKHLVTADDFDQGAGDLAHMSFAFKGTDFGLVVDQELRVRHSALPTDHSDLYKFKFIRATPDIETRITLTGEHQEVVPEPSTMIALGSGVLFLLRRREKGCAQR